MLLLHCGKRRDERGLWRGSGQPAGDAVRGMKEKTKDILLVVIFLVVIVRPFVSYLVAVLPT